MRTVHCTFFELNHKHSNDIIQIYLHFIANKYMKLVSISQILHTFTNEHQCNWWCHVNMYTFVYDCEFCVPCFHASWMCTHMLCTKSFYCCINTKKYYIYPTYGSKWRSGATHNDTRNTEKRRKLRTVRTKMRKRDMWWGFVGLIRCSHSILIPSP